MDSSTLLHLAVKAALVAGEDIMNVYKTDFSFERKSDNTPVTIADRAASKRIVDTLSSSGIPSISEEETLPAFEIRKNWEKVWIIDPLDGTKEFIKKNGEFTVNIALIHKQAPVIGVIYAPVWNKLYFASNDLGSFLVEASERTHLFSFDELLKDAKQLPLQKTPATYTLVASRSHLSHEINQRMQQIKSIYGEVNLIHAGSSIKQCWVAEGRAHEYSRLGTTMEWDTAAGQCILEQAGCSLRSFDTNEPLNYNKENPENPFFIAKNLN